MFMFVLKDLVTDMSHFYAQYKSIDLMASTSACSALAVNRPAHLTGGIHKTTLVQLF